MDKDFARELDFKYINFLAKIRNIHKVEKKLYQHYVSKNIHNRHVDLLRIEEEG